MDDLMKRADSQLRNPPKEPPRDLVAIGQFVDGDAIVHVVWGDPAAALYLQDMARKLRDAEARLAKIDGNLN